MNKRFVLAHVSKHGYSSIAVFKKRGKKVKKLETLEELVPEESTSKAESTTKEEAKTGGKIYKAILTGMGNLDFSSDNVKKTKRENIKLIV